MSDTLIADFKRLTDIKGLLNYRARSYALENKISKPDSCIKEIEKICPFFKLTYIEEGTVLFFELNNKALLGQALKTAGRADDKLFSLLKEVWGDYGEEASSFPVWIDRKTCLSGYSVLGDGTHTKVLKNLSLLRQEKNVQAKKTANEIYDMVIDDLNYRRSFGNSKEAAAKELQSIIDDKYLFAEQDKNKLLEGKKNLSNKEMQFDCRTKKCQFE